MYDIEISYMISYFFIYMIYDMISHMISVRLQLPILPRHSALMSVMLTWIDQWMPTRSVTMLTKTPSDRDMEEDAEILATLLQHIPLA